ncbi:Alpha/Beta hydrolase protein [Schizophyllum amplum]|uniref:Alpha/Beta hydrolase protein n=1 Tax=Schizophyllum amplum TaxID=97359 RepID=A0A550C5G1_9AGAR|nr:Alpha/Beta hydrolase protein [Auriculariopsis ampla]
MLSFRPFFILLSAALASALNSTLTQVTDALVNNPTNIYFGDTPYAQLADEYANFIVVYPSTPNSDNCWDVSSTASLTRDGGGDSTGIASMVQYAKDTWGVPADKVFVTGTSSGGMMTNVLAATYPDVFAAGVVYSGVAAGCFASDSSTVDAWNSTCALGDAIGTSEQWASIVHDMYPGYTGTYPRMQEYHGDADEWIFPQNLEEEVKQWAGVFGYNANAPGQVQADAPSAGYTKSVYGESLQGILAEGVGHTVPVQGEEDLRWFGII